MKQRYQLDSHKLQYHPGLVADFLAGKDIVPLNVEISLTDACNHRCLFCNFSYLGHTNTMFPKGRMPVLVGELARAGVKTLTFAGAGEPLLHPDLFPSLRTAHTQGMELALSTNGALFQSGQMEEAVDLLTWIRFSINGGSRETYAAVHNASAADFDTVMKNLAQMGEAKRKKESPMTLGTQCLLLKENYREIKTLAEKVRDAGADYFVVKHFYPREESGYKGGESFQAQDRQEELAAIANEISTDSFVMIVRDSDNLERVRSYRECAGLSFLGYIAENGLLFTCFSHQDDEKTAVGNLLEQDFVALWHSEGKARAIQYINEYYDKNMCQANCRHHQINIWLQQLKHPPAHVNFI